MVVIILKTQRTKEWAERGKGQEERKKSALGVQTGQEQAPAADDHKRL